jgi:predicted transcriptional regulator of viral defense system
MDESPELLESLESLESLQSLQSLQSLSATHDGLIPASGLRQVGIGSRAASVLVSHGLLVRVRRGVYVEPGLWSAGRAEDRYRLFVRATAAVATRPLVLSHMSAAALHGLPKVGDWPKTVHAIDTDAMGGSSARFITTHRGGPKPAQTLIAGIAVTSLARTLVDVAATSSFLTGVGMVDHVLREERERVSKEKEHGVFVRPALTKADLYAELGHVAPRTGGRRARQVIDFATDAAANIGESLSRVRILELGFEVPEVQVHVLVNGSNYYVDFYWRRIRKMAEFDGKHKYTRGAILGDRDPADVVMLEKLREDDLRPHCDSFTRWDWDTAISPRKFHSFLLRNGVPRA